MKILFQEHRGEALCLMLLGATALALLIGSSTLPDPMFDPLGPAGMPRYIGFLLILFLVLRFVMLVRESSKALSDNIGPNQEAPENQEPLVAKSGDVPGAEGFGTPQVGRLALASAIILAYLAALTVGGLSFAWLTFVFLAALGTAMTDLTRKELITVAIIAAVMSFALTYTFADILSVVLPE